MIFGNKEQILYGNRFNGTKGNGYQPIKKEQTNEEWFDGLSTEEKAEWIAKQKCDGCHDEPYDEKYSVCKYCMEKKTEQVREWLKQPHQSVTVETRWDADDIKTPPFTDAQERVIQATEKLNEKCNKINAEVNKWGRKRICDVDDDL